MAWNGSNCAGDCSQGTYSIATKRKTNHPRPSTWRIWVGGISATLLICVAALWLWYSSKRNSGDSSQGKSVSTEKASTEIATPQVNASKGTKPLPQDKTWRPKTVPDKTANIKPPALSEEKRLRFKAACEQFFGKQIFTQPSDNIIAGVLSARPGTRFLPITIGEQFEKDFVESLSHPIELKDDDTEEERSLKEAVIGARDMLKDNMDKGYSISEIIRDARAETDRITDYREKLNDNLMLLLAGGSEEDVTQYLEECNTILAEYDAMPLHISKFGWKKLRKRLEAEAAGEPRQTPSL